jgi:hypothetical protein
MGMWEVIGISRLAGREFEVENPPAPQVLLTAIPLCEGYFFAGKYFIFLY